MNDRNCGVTAGMVGIVQELAAGRLFRFADWPDDQVPRRAAGVYTVWRADEFLYVGMSGRGAQREDIVVDSGQRSPAKGLWTRLNSHASGRRSGDQFNLYICDRFIVPVLTSVQQRDIGQGHLLLDQLTRSFIRDHLSYRFAVYGDGAEALAVERTGFPATGTGPRSCCSSTTWRPRRGRAPRPSTWSAPALTAARTGCGSGRRRKTIPVNAVHGLPVQLA